MIDPRIIQALSSSDADKRKKAVAYLAKSLDRDVLPYLARIYKNDSDPEIRELAKKAVAYIQKNVPQITNTDDVAYDDEPNEQPVSYSRYDNLYVDDDPDDDDRSSSSHDDIPLLSNITVSPVAEERAKTFVEQAMDWNVRGKDDRAVNMLRKAFTTNPRLLYDSYTISLATNITGLSADDVRRMFAPSAKQLEKSGMVSKGTLAETRRLNGIQQFFALIVFLGATSVLIGFFAVPWVDFGWIPVPDSGNIASQLGDFADFDQLNAVGVNVNNFNTVGGTLSEFQRLLNSPQVRELESQAGVFGAQGRLIRDGLNGLRSIRAGASGMDVMLYMIGTQDALRAFFGLGGVIDTILAALDDPMVLNLIVSAFQSQLPDLGALGVDVGSLNPDTIRAAINIGLAQLKYTPQATDFLIIIVPIAGSLAFLFALLLYMTSSMMWWVLNIGVGLAGFGACAYFYTTAINNVLNIAGTDTVAALQQAGINVTSATQFIGIGFWMSMGGVIAVTIAPFLGLLFAPTKQDT